LIICSDVALIVYDMQARNRKLGLLESDDMDKDDELAEENAMEETLTVAKNPGNFYLIYFGFYSDCLCAVLTLILIFSQIILKDLSTRNW
jgi:hypothetical protein